MNYKRVNHIFPKKLFKGLNKILHCKNTTSLIKPGFAGVTNSIDSLVSNTLGFCIFDV
jgi:hypothetical protein